MAAGIYNLVTLSMTTTNITTINTTTTIIMITIIIITTTTTTPVVFTCAECRCFLSSLKMLKTFGRP